MADSSKSASDHKQESPEKLTKEVHWLQHATFWSQVVLGIIGIGALWIYHGQLEVMQGTLVEMRRTTEIQERPWLSIEAESVNGMTFVNGKQPVLALKVSIRNVGHSIAKNIQVDAKMFPTDAGMPIALDAAEHQRELCDRPKINQIGLIDLFPGSEPVVRVLSIGASAPEVEKHSAAVNGRSFVGLYVVGCASYRSSFSPNFHQTRFSYHLVGPLVFDQNRRPLMIKGMPILGAFEVGVNVPRDKMGMWQELFGHNESN